MNANGTGISTNARHASSVIPQLICRVLTAVEEWAGGCEEGADDGVACDGGGGEHHVGLDDVHGELHEDGEEAEAYKDTADCRDNLGS